MNKMAKNTYLSPTESKKRTKQTRRTNRIMDMESILMVARWEEVMEEWVKMEGLIDREQDDSYWWRAGLGTRGLSKKEKGLVDMDNSVVTAGKRGVKIFLKRNQSNRLF